MSRPSFRRYPLYFALGAIASVSILACGGGGGGGDRVEFRGRVTRSLTTTPPGTDSSNDTTTTTLPLRPCPTSGQGITICAFDSCDTSSSLGDWSFSVRNFGGGDVDLFLTGCGVDAVVRLPDLNANTLRVEVDLAVESRTRATITNLIQYGDPDDESPDDDIGADDDDGDDEALPIDEAENEI